MIHISNGYLSPHVPNASRFTLLVNNDFTGGGAESGMPTDEQIAVAFADDGQAKLKTVTAIAGGQIILIDVEPSPRHANEIIDAEVDRYIEVHDQFIDHIRRIANELHRQATIALYGVPLTDTRGRSGQAIAKDDAHPFTKWWADDARKPELEGKQDRRNAIYGRMKRSRDDDGRINAIGIIDKADIICPIAYADATVFDFADDARRQFRFEYWLPQLIREALNSTTRVMPMFAAHGWVNGEIPPLPEAEVHSGCQIMLDAGVTDIILFEDWNVKAAEHPEFHANLAIINDYFGEAG